MNIHQIIRLNLLLLSAVIILLNGCATPTLEQRPSSTEILHPDEDDDLGGTFLESGDIRTIATRMSAALLSTPEIGNNPDIVRIAISPVRNNTRFVVDNEIFTNRLRLELNRIAKDRIRFFSQTAGQQTRRKIIQEQDEEYWDELINQVADYIVNSRPIQSAKHPPTIAVIPVRNTNIVGLNADSFTALLRSRIAEKSEGKIHFLAREKNGKVLEEILDEKDVKGIGLVKARNVKSLYGVDFFLGGEFIAKSLMTEGSKNGVEEKPNASSIAPNVDKYVNVWLIDADTAAIYVEKLVRIGTKVMSGLARANYILTGQLSGLSKASAGGSRSDYLMMSFQLVDPITNEVLWEDAYETKKKSDTSTLYR
jgi:hypothetical protein